MRFLSLTKRATLKAASLLLVVAVATPVFAQDAAPQRIAVLDMAGALFNSERAKVVDAEIQAQTAEDNAKVNDLREQAQTLQQKLDQDAAVMSDDEKRKTTEQIQEIGVQFQFLVEKLQALVEERRQQFQQQHAQALITAIQAVIEEGQYDFVLRAEAALHFDTEYDITARVTEKLNQQP